MRDERFGTPVYTIELRDEGLGIVMRDYGIRMKNDG